MEGVSEFCYLGDVIGAGGGAREASMARVRCAWAKFSELGAILKRRGASLRVKGNLFRTLRKPMGILRSKGVCEKGKV